MKTAKIKTILKYFKKAFLLLIGFILLYALAAFVLPYISIAAEDDPQDDVTIYIKTNGVHTDIVVPTRNEQIDWSKEAKFSHIASGNTNYQYLAIGWGDKGFYLETPTWAELKASVAFKAATGLSSSAIHTTYYREMNIGKACRKIQISKNQYANLIKYIQESIRPDANGHWVNIETDANYGNSDAFYEAKGRYSLFYTCNSWANNALRACGQKHCLWTPFDKGIFKLYE